MIVRAVAASTLVALLAAPAGAVPPDLSRPLLHRGPTASPTPIATPRAAHTVFGQIVRLMPTSFILQLRGGRLLTVDSSAPLETGRYSAPLFVGKFVVVTGDIGANRIFLANSITRMERIDPSIRQDH